MDTKKIAASVVFAAVTIVLNLSPLKFPAPYAPFLIYQVWEIPIVVAYLLFGFLVGAFVSLINTAMLLMVFPGELPTGPFYNLTAILSMLFGIFLIEKLSSKDIRNDTIGVPIVSTISGVLFRVGIMTIVNLLFLPFAPPIGFGIPVPAVIATLPLIGVFNATLALYTIIIGYLVAKVVHTRL